MEIILLLGAILVIGYFFGLVAERFGFPRVTSYLLAGILFSQDLLGHELSLNIELWSDIFSKICLGFIAYIVGSEIHLDKLVQHKKVTILATLFSSILPVVFVFCSFYFLSLSLGFSNYMAIVLSAVASTTDPAATFAVIDQYNIKGEVADTAIKIVAIDDALGIIIFAIISIFFLPNGSGSTLELVVREIGGSVLLGIILGYFLSRFAKLSISNDFLLPLLTGLVLIAVSVSELYHLSGLMVCIALGFVANIQNKSDSKVSLLLPIKHIKELIFITFFTIAGTHFSIKHFSTGFLLILVYIVARGLGKYVGAYIGSKIGKTSNPNVPKYLGLTLLPQAGVAIGLVIQVVQLPEIAPFKDLIFNIILGSTVVYEVLGPFVAKIAFKKAGEM
ncbi:cation:proton antiporter [Bacteriovoracaceae bacterium]|nr:cation:proton antiporter [Bacteriovoracaceae bacterium]